MAPAPAPELKFVPSATYVGPVPGVVFKLGDQGQGYYTDTGFGTLSESRSRCRNSPVDVCAGTNDDSDSSEDEDDEERYVTFMGCTLVYIFLTAALYDQLSQKLRAPHYSLNLCDPEVYRLILEAARSGECKIVGDREYLDAYFEGKDHFHCPKTWRGGSA